jgi:hypothetical protein
VAVGGTTNTITKFTSSTTIGDSSITDDGTTIILGNVTRIDVASGNIDGQGSADIINFNNIQGNVKSFDIVHPTKGKPWRLRYGVLEGPEHGVYFRGQTTKKVIELPDYWTGLVHENSYTANLTPIGEPIQHFVVKIENHKVYIDSETGNINTFFLIQAERKDVDKVLLEYNPTKE